MYKLNYMFLIDDVENALLEDYNEGYNNVRTTLAQLLRLERISNRYTSCSFPCSDGVRMQFTTPFHARGCRKRRLRDYNMHVAYMQVKKYSK